MNVPTYDFGGCLLPASLILLMELSSNLFLHDFLYNYAIGYVSIYGLFELYIDWTYFIAIDKWIAHSIGYIVKTARLILWRHVIVHTLPSRCGTI